MAYELTFFFTNVINLKKLNLNKRLINNYIYIYIYHFYKNNKFVQFIHNFPPVKYLTP